MNDWILVGLAWLGSSLGCAYIGYLLGWRDMGRIARQAISGRKEKHS